MPLKSPTGTRYPGELSKTELVQIFAARAGGKAVKDIAKDFKITPSSCTRVLNREIHAGALIPLEFVQKVRELARSKKKIPSRSRGPRPKQVHGATEALVAYLVAVEAVETAATRCRDRFGYTDESLNLIVQAQRNTRK